MAAAVLTRGRDHFSGRSDQDNVFLFSLDDICALDTIDGTNSSVFFDFLIATSAGIIAGSQLFGVRGADILVLSSRGNSVSLTNTLAAGTSHGIFAVIGGAGNDSVDASGVTNGARVAFYAGGGSDSFAGGNGNDYAEFAPADFSAADSVAGGLGFDYLAFGAGGAVSAAALANVGGIEALMLGAAGNSVALTNALVAGAGNLVMSVIDGGGDDTVDASGVTNSLRVAFFAGHGADTFIGGNGSDYLSFGADELTADDHIAAGLGCDIIEFSTAGIVNASAFDHVTGIDELILNAGGNAVTLSNAVVAGADNGVLVVLDGAGDDNVDASDVAASRVIFAATTGSDSFTGGGGSDVALFSADGLTAADTFAGGAGFDILQFTTAGTVDVAAFANVSGLDELFLNLGGNAIALDGAMVANSDNGAFVVYDTAGHNAVDASAATLGGRVIFFAASGDHNSYTGGSGSDFFLFGADNLNASDTLAGGGGSGTDFLVVKTPGRVTAADLAHVSQMEVVQLEAGGSIAFGDAIADGAMLQADGSAAADTFDGSAVTAFDLVMRGNGGADTLLGGAGNDRFFVANVNFVAIDGGNGADTIVLTSAFDFSAFDLGASAEKIRNIEAISLEGADDAIIKLGPDDILQAGSAAHSLYLIGGGDDQFDLRGTGWTLLETDHVNVAISPDHTFVHLHNANGADLYVDTLFPITVAWEADSLF